MRYQRSANLTSQRTNSARSRINNPRLAIGFSLQATEPATIEFRCAKQLKELAEAGLFSPVSVSVDARQATLRGVVGSREEGQLLESFLLMEPGLSEVVNLLEVRQSPR